MKCCSKAAEVCLPSSWVKSTGDAVHVAPGYYSESTGEDFSGAGIGGYLVKEEVQFRFWDIGNDLPHVHPGQVVLKTEGDKASAFVFEDIGDPAQSGLRFARTFNGPPAETLKLLRLEGFTETAIRVLGSRDGPKLAGDALLLTGIEWVDCDAALFIEADGRNTQLWVLG
mgnify:FL=1